MTTQSAGVEGGGAMLASVNPVGPTVPHHTYLGGSDIAAIVGLSQYKTPLDVWAEKTRRVAFGGNERTRAGSHFERPILDLYAAETGARLTFPGTLVDGWMGATPDALEGDSMVDVQVKMVGLHQSKRWDDVALGADGVPPELLAQVHWESEMVRRVLGSAATSARVVAQLGTEQRVYSVELDADFTAALVDQAERFWRDHVLTDRMPAVSADSSDTLRAVYRKTNRAMANMPGDVADMVRAYHAARCDEAEAAARKGVAGALLCAAIGELGGFVAPGMKATWTPQKGRIDWKAYALALGGTEKGADAFRGIETRVLRVNVEED